MQGFQDLFVAALFGLVFACIIAKFVSVAFYGVDDNDSKVKVDANKAVKVVEQVNLGNALKVRESRSKKRVKFVDGVVVKDVHQFGIGNRGHEIEEEVEKVVFDGAEVVIVEGKNGKDGIFMCSDEQKVNEDGKILMYSEGVNKGMSDEASERGIIGERNGIANFDQHLSLEEENVIIRGDTEKVEILKCDDEYRVKEDGNMIYTLEGMEASTSGSVLEGLMVDEKIKNVVIDDDWEGIERTELEKVFGEAVNYVEFGLKGKEVEFAKLGSDVQMQLYGLHKIAVEGFCYQAQPMALNFSARAKWNAWQKLRTMSPEVAMEEYIQLLTKHFPDWMQHFCGEDGENKSLESGISPD